jgi:hypothetical protein
MLRSILRRGSSARPARRRRIALGQRLLGADIRVPEVLENRWLLSALAPVNVAASGISASAIALNWKASTDPTVTGYDVYEVIVVVSGGGKGSHGSHTVYNLVGANLHTNSDTISGLQSGTNHTYVVTAVNSSGQSLYSYPATAATWSAPRLLYGNYFQLSTGYETLGPAPATVGLTTQVTLYVGGNPLTYSKVSGPSTLSINSKTGVITYTPAAGDVGLASATLKASSALGSVTQTIQFSVAANSNLPKPKLQLSGLTATYNGQFQTVTVAAVGTDGVTPVAGTFSFAYNGSATTPPFHPGTNPVLVTFTSADPKYGSATVVTSMTVNKAVPTFSFLTLSAPTIAVGAATITVSGSLGAGATVPTGDYVIVTINGASQDVVVKTNGTFSTVFPTSSLPVGHYQVTYAFAGDSNFKAAPNGTSTLIVVPLAVPTVTQNPTDQTTSAGDPATFTATATGSPTITVQWQVSIDGGQTWINVTGPTSNSTTLVFYTATGETGYKFRAVFTNSAGVTDSSVATLTVEADSGGDS